MRSGKSRVLAMVRAMGAAGAFNIDSSRFYRETLPPHVYLSSSYYKKWFLGLEEMLIEKGYLDPRGSRGRPCDDAEGARSTASSTCRCRALMARGNSPVLPRPGQVQHR